MLALIAPLASLVGIEADHLASRLKGLAIAYSVIGLLALTGFGFLAGAGYLALSGVVGAIYAALIFGGAFLLLALAVYAGLAIGEARDRKRRMERRRTTDTGALLTTAAVSALPLLTRSPLLVKLGLPAAAVAILMMLRKDEE